MDGGPIDYHQHQATIPDANGLYFKWNATTQKWTRHLAVDEDPSESESESA